MATGKKTALMSRKTPGGVWNVEDQSLSTGDRYFVGSTVTAASDATTHGASPDRPFATIDYAVGQSTASQGDIIYVMPGHVEVVASAAALDLDVAGIKVIGLGWGDSRPKVQLSANLSTVEFNADDMWVENIIFEGTFATGVAVGLDIKTGCDDLTLKNCVIRGTAAANELLQAVTIEATNSFITFEGCEFTEYVGDATACVTTEGAFYDLRFIDCYFNGTWDTACLDLDAAAVTTQALYMRDCTIINHHATGGAAVTLDDTTIAQFLRVNTFCVQSNTLPLLANDDGGSLGIQCYGTDLLGTSGIAWPATATVWT